VFGGEWVEIIRVNHVCYPAILGCDWNYANQQLDILKKEIKFVQKSNFSLFPSGVFASHCKGEHDPEVQKVLAKGILDLQNSYLILNYGTK